MHITKNVNSGFFMNNGEIWTKWEPVEGLAKIHTIRTIIDKIDVLILNFFESYDEDKRFQLIFDASVIGYRCVDEGIRLMINENSIQHEGKDIYGQWTFFKVENSSYIRWLKAQSGLDVDFSGIVHFAMITDNYIVDVASANEPIVQYSV